LGLCYEETKQIKALFDDLGLPYRLKASSRRGFHFLIEYEDLEQLGFSTPEEQLDFNIKLIHKLIKVYDLSCLDPAGFDFRKIWKADYSICYKTGVIALPLRDSEFESFNPQFLTPRKVLTLPGLGFRGLLKREKFNKEKVKAWIKDIILQKSYCPTCKTNFCLGAKKSEVII